MLAPKQTKFRKWQTGRKHASKLMHADTRGVAVSFGSWGLKAMTPGRVTSAQIEASRKTAARLLGKTGRMWVRVFPDRPYTQKSAEVPMGSGKGDVAWYVVPVRPGRVLFEVDGLPEAVAKEALRKAGTKLPIKSKVVAR